MHLLKVFETCFFKRSFSGSYRQGVADGQKAQLDIKKHGGGMILIIVLVISGNYGKSARKHE